MNHRVRLKAVVLAIAGAGLVPMTHADGATPDPGVTFLAKSQRGEVSPPALEDIEQMCALLTSCEALPIPPSVIPGDFGACVRGLSEDLTRASALSFSLTIRECGLRANTCAELRTCALRGAKADACAGRGKSGAAGYCDVDGRALTCSHERVIAVRDCPRGGEQCSVREGQAMCVLGPCTTAPDAGPAAPVSSRTAPDPIGPACSASGTRILQCEKGKLVSLDCAAFGLKCTPQPGGAACAPPTTACVGEGKRCDGSVAVECFRGHEVRIDCAASGLACGGTGTVVGSCVAPLLASGACDPASAPRCDGASLKYCAAGRPRSFPCKALSFNRCVVDPKGARCAN